MRKSMNLQDLRRRIYVKAKAEPSWRFWGLYVHVCKLETLREAYRLAKKNNGAPGIDGVTFEARFTKISDSAIGYEGSAAAAIAPSVSQHLALSSVIDVGSRVAMVTTEGRLAEFTVTKIDLSRNPGLIDIAFTVWKGG